jgi:WD40 repeat protein
VSRIFLSHSSRDNRQSVALVQWLSDVRPELATEIFLDVSAERGLRPGQRWKEALRQANDRCEAVICLLSHNWESSPNCKTEYLTAENLGKQILVVRLEDIGDTDITSEWQRCDLFADGAQSQIAVSGGPPVRFNTAALDQLKKAIEGTGIGPENFVWPPKDDPQRAPYRGWEPFEDTDTGVFFGRDAAIVRGTDELRAMRIGGLRSLFVVLGPSGSGKSSFLRAGLIPRLQRDDRHFRVLGIARPERNALTGDHGFAAAIHTARQALHLPGAPLGEIKNACLNDPDRVAELLGEVRAAAAKRLADAGHDGVAPTLVLPLDQAEELFSADAGEQAEQFLVLIADLMRRLNTGDAGLIVAATIRTDRYEVMQNHPALDGIGTALFNELKPMPSGHFSQVITGPAARASHGGQQLTIAPNLVNRLLEDATEGADTLPLLALTLARLYADYSTNGELTVTDYEAMGGMRHVVKNAIDKALAAEPAERANQLDVLRAAFIPWLATINPDNDQPMRRVARYADLPEASRPLVDALVEKRLLVRDERDGQVVVEVALESLLRQWDELAGWLRAERQNLKTADDIERNATAWATHDHDPAWLLTGTRLTDAETLASTAGFSARLAGARDYLAASRAAENQRLAKEEEQRRAELRHAQERQQTAEAHAKTLRRRSRILRAVLVGTAVIAVIAVVGAIVAVVGFVQATHAKHQADARTREAIVLRLTSQGQAMLAGVQAGGDVRAIQQIRAAPAIAPTTDISALLDAVVARQTTIKIMPSPQATWSVAFSPDGHRIVSGSADNDLHVWNADTGQQIGAPLTGHTSWVLSVAFSPDGRRIVSGSDDNTVRLWDAGTGHQIGTPLTGHTAAVFSVAFSPDGRRIVSGSDDNTVRLWDAGTGQQVGAPLTGHTDGVNSVAFSPDGHRIVSGSDDNTVRLWDADTGQQIGTPLTGHTATVFSVAFSPDGRRIVSGSHDNTVRLWDAGTGQQVGAPLTGHTAAVFSVAFSRDGHRIVSGSYDNTVRLWDADTGQQIGTPLIGHTNWVRSVAFSPDGRRIVSGSEDNTVRLWDADTRAQIGTPLTGQIGGVNSVAFSPDGHRIASGSDDATVRLWDADTRTQIGTPLTGQTGTVNSVAFSPDGHRIVSGSLDDTVRLWDADTGAPIGAPLTGHTGYVRHTYVTSVAFSPDGHRIVSGSADTTVRLWDADTGQPIGAPLTGHTGGVDSVAFSPDGHRIVSGSTDDTLRLWGADTRTQIGAPLTGHTGGVSSVAFSPDGHRIVSGSTDQTLRLWDTATHEQIGVLIGCTNWVNSVAFSPDGHRIVSGSQDDTVRLWPGPAAWPDLLCDKLVANMSHKQWRDWVSPDIPYITVCPGLRIAPD